MDEAVFTSFDARCPLCRAPFSHPLTGDPLIDIDLHYPMHDDAPDIDEPGPDDQTVFLPSEQSHQHLYAQGDPRRTHTLLFMRMAIDRVVSDVFGNSDSN